jgi:hypothetical protein
MTEFTDKDLQQLSEKGISREQVKNQIAIFKEGIPYVRLEQAAVIDNGIIQLGRGEENELAMHFDDMRAELDLLKFIPASGAASRMFKALFNFLDQYDPDSEALQDYLEGDPAMTTFVEGIRELPFYTLVNNRIKGKTASRDKEIYFFVEEMLQEDKLNFGFYPKGLLPFHNYGTYVATPFEEHLKEAASYASSEGSAKLHFTISEQHGKLFNQEFDAIKKRVSAATNCSFTLEYSYQKPSTDTIAVTLEDNPFRTADEAILFRPGGHGALIENLDEQEADIIFIKNIDNVVVPENSEVVGHSKKVLAGLLLKLQDKAHQYAQLLEDGQLSGEQLQEIQKFLKQELNVRVTESYSSYSIAQQIDVLKDKINRPIRVCGMVRNEGQPGGGPFWIKDSKGNVSLQIIESAQVDRDNANQLEIFNHSTHFNPVDLVCGVKDYKGQKYPLGNFVDSKQGFITSKTQEGKSLKAMELPGLWNGGMAFWNTVFVEVPSKTFNPVKTVNDLLKPSHQVNGFEQ